jgi:hypothetical protein
LGSVIGDIVAICLHAGMLLVLAWESACINEVGPPAAGSRRPRPWQGHATLTSVAFFWMVEA